jgi:hypothetical protein
MVQKGSATPRGANVRKRIYNAQNYANVKIWKAQNGWKLIVIMDLMKILMMMTMNFRLF